MHTTAGGPHINQCRRSTRALLQEVHMYPNTGGPYVLIQQVHTYCYRRSTCKPPQEVHTYTNTGGPHRRSTHTTTPLQCYYERSTLTTGTRGPHTLLQEVHTHYHASTMFLQEVHTHYYTTTTLLQEVHTHYYRRSTHTTTPLQCYYKRSTHTTTGGPHTTTGGSHTLRRVFWMTRLYIVGADLWGVWVKRVAFSETGSGGRGWDRKWRETLKPEEAGNVEAGWCWDAREKTAKCGPCVRRPTLWCFP